MDRRQAVCINDRPIYSSQQLITCGVPQRSILGPLLFSVYINDLLPRASKFETRLYADDTALMLSGMDRPIEQLNENVNSELLKVENWLNSNKLSLNYSRTNYYFTVLIEPHFNSSNSHTFEANINGKIIDKCSSTKYLGVFLDENISWKPHIQYLSKKFSQGVIIIVKMRKYLNENNLIALAKVT